MRTLLRFAGLSLCIGLLLIASCKDDPTKKEVFIKKLSRKWKPSSAGVTFNSQPVNGVYDNFSVTFTKKLTYATTDGQDPVWRASGKFTIQAEQTPVGFSLLRDDGVEIVVNELTDSRLVLAFAFTKKTGRINSVSGGYVFDLVPE